MPRTRTSERLAAVPLIDRVMRSVERDQDGCLIFTAGKISTGYGLVGGKTTGRKLAHVVVWEHHHGPVPEGSIVGHACHDAASRAGTCAVTRCKHRACVELSHLQAMTYRRNSSESANTGSAPQDACRAGLHDLTQPGARAPSGAGKTMCRECRNAQARADRAAMRAWRAQTET